MSLLAFGALPAWATPISLALHLAAGIGLGALYFGSVLWTALLFGTGGGARIVVASMAARFALLGCALLLVSFEGALPLLVTALGILVARTAVLRRVRAA